MARGKSSAYARPDVASKGRFDLLNLDAGSSDSEEELPPPASSLSPSASTTPSKKALQRQRAKLRKKNSHLDLNGNGGNTPDDSDVSAVDAAASFIPPVPPLPSAAEIAEIANGKAEDVMDKAAEVTETVFQSAPAPVQAKAPLGKEDHKMEEVDEKASAPEPKKEDLPASSFAQAAASSLPTEAPYVPPVTSAERPAPVAAPASVSDSEAESQRGFSDDEDDDEDEEEDAPSTATPASPKPASPRPSTPTPPSSSAVLHSSAPKEAYTGADHDPNKKIKAIIQRTVWGMVMAFGAISLVAMGHVYVVALVFIVQAVVFKELTGLFDAGYSGAHVDGEGKVARTPAQEAKRKGRKEERERWSRRMAWYFFAVANYYLYGESLIYYFRHILTLQASFLPTAYSFAQHHRLISFGLYTIGFVSFVATLSRSSLRRQFGLFGWIHMSLLLIVVSSHFIVNNILEGMIWFWIPASLVIINDVAAYVCGMLFGRHQLIKLSPKKTVEGFVGAFFVTIVFAVGWSTLFMRFPYMTCPAQDLSTNAFSSISCKPNQVFVWREAAVPDVLTPFVGQTISWAPFQLHSIVLAAFASLVAPFGGFFASGFKRAFNIKDFGDSIPGHGGMTDRMDCQFLMGLFSYVYYAALVRESHVTPQTVLATIVTHLTTEDQLELFKDLGKLLAQKGVKAAVPW
ncbi:hypothetical protein JCM8547_007410 [Rhodosporidiobolus lusitaniae]